MRRYAAYFCCFVFLSVIAQSGIILAAEQDVPDFAATQKAAEQGDADAQYRLAVMYKTGRDVPQDHHKSMKWFLKAAEQGNYSAQFNVGVGYLSGRGVPKDGHKAVEWFHTKLQSNGI